ncbi:unnamed protein product [Lupinus luteus]|uniref:Uncharacterized protein n=1 Tax=Lupinus luteus TaxID=3873 RepID=A0AAV1YEG2_LUPLU
MQVYPSGSAIDSMHSDPSEKEDAQSSLNYSFKQGIHPPPTFGSSSNLETLPLQTTKNNIEDGGSAMGVKACFPRSNICQIRAYFLLLMNNAGQGWKSPLIAYKYLLMELMCGKLIPIT